MLRAADERTRFRGRGEQSARELLNDEIDKDPDIEAILLFEDNDVGKRGFVRGLPKRVGVLATGDLMR